MHEATKKAARRRPFREMRREAVSISLRQLRAKAEVTIRLPGTVNSLDIGSPPFIVDTAPKVGACPRFVKRAFSGLD